MQRVFIEMNLLLAIIFALCLQPVQAQSDIHLKVLGQAVIPYNYSYKNTPVGGLSGLTYDQKSGDFYVISDDRSQKAAARFYTVKVHLNKKGRLENGGIRFVGMHRLHMRDGKTYPKGRIDPEGITIGPDDFIYVSSEGVPGKDVAPFIDGYSKDGTFARALTIPNAFWSPGGNHSRHGVRSNLAFESLTATPDSKTIYAATENALLQDGPAADSTHSSPARIIMYDLPSGNILHEYQYNVDPVHLNAHSHGSFMINGLSDLLALDNKGDLLALERNFVAKQGFRISLYEVSTRNATDIKGVNSIKQYNRPIRPVKKRLIAHLSKYNIAIDNFEGLALGPSLPGGGRLLLMVSDNNFLPIQRTLFTAFALHRH